MTLRREDLHPDDEKWFVERVGWAMGSYGWSREYAEAQALETIIDRERQDRDKERRRLETEAIGKVQKEEALEARFKSPPLRFIGRLDRRVEYGENTDPNYKYPLERRRVRGGREAFRCTEHLLRVLALYRVDRYREDY